MRRILASTAFAAAFAAAVASAADPQPQGVDKAQEINGPREYATCVALAKARPEAGWEEALAWQSLGGGEAARHCAAIALIGLGKHDEAAERLEKLANESVRSEMTRAGMLEQAGQAWLLAGKVDRADAALRAALVLAPGHPDILLDRAVVLAQVHQYKEAAEILSEVLSRQPNRVEAFALRASARRYQDDLKGAEADVGRALELDPGYPEALVERGIIRRLLGDDAGARADWLKVVQTLPSGPELDQAQRNLQLMDVKAPEAKTGPKKK